MYILLLICVFLQVCEKGLCTYSLGQFQVAIPFESEPNALITVLNKDSSVVWRTIYNTPFLTVGNATLERPPILNGNYQVEEAVELLSNRVSISKIVQDNLQLNISGQLLNGYDAWIAEFALVFSVADVNTFSLRFDIDLVYNPTLRNISPRTYFTYASDSGENFYGFGESFTYFNLKGYRVPILVSEQGVGRGTQPITDYLNSEVSPGVGGDAFTTYAPKPVYLTNYNHSLVFDYSETSYFNLTVDSVVEVEVWSSSVSGWIIFGATMLDVVESITEFTGRMSPLPQWTQQGAVVGLEGGTTSVSAIVRSMLDNNVPIAGVWLQDWVGLRHSWDGDRLIWNWEVNYDYYPGWNGMVDGWKARGINVLTYISPFFSDPSNFTSDYRHNYYQEGVEGGYFVKHANGSVYTMYSLSIEFAMVDLSNPAAVRWMKNLLINSTINEAQSSGWMCDFGEYLPFDAVMFNGESGASYHNKYPQMWGQLASEAVAEVGRSQDIVYFMRSAWSQSPPYVPVFWLGDQLICWDGNDGLRSVITGALSSGLTGHAITHSDIGGYTVESIGPDMTYLRSPELLKRWSELSAFGFGLYRTHIGSNTTKADAQVYDSVDSMRHFGEFASIFGNLSAYRLELMQQAKLKGYPLVRPLAMHYGYDAAVWDIIDSYLVGTELLVAPCLTEGATNVTVYFPKYSGPWIHLWSGNVISADSRGAFSLTVPAPLGFPPVFYRSDSLYGSQLRSFVVQQNYTYGYSWKYDESTSDHKTWWYRQSLAVRISLVGGLLLFLFLMLYWFTSVYCGGRKAPGHSRLDEESLVSTSAAAAAPSVLPSAPPSDAHVALLSANPVD